MNPRHPSCEVRRATEEHQCTERYRTPLKSHSKVTLAALVPAFLPRVTSQSLQTTERDSHGWAFVPKRSFCVIQQEFL